MIFTGFEPVLTAWRAIVITYYTKRPAFYLFYIHIIKNNSSKSYFNINLLIITFFKFLINKIIFIIN